MIVAEVWASWEFKPRRKYEVAGTLVTSVRKPDRDGFEREVEERTEVFLDIDSGLIVGNRERFETFMEPLECSVRQAEWARGYDD
jgi:hypothetical protein